MACVVCGVMAVSMFAVPAYRGWQTKTLPDGSQITVRQMGDEFFHYWETEDGKQAFEQADGTFVVTGEAVPTKAQARAKRAASTLQSSKPRKAIGERNLAPRGLLVLVQFSDVTFKSANNNAAFNDMLNKAGYNYNGATGSAVDYFHAQSNNAYNPTFDVVGPVTLSHNLKYYGEQGTINGYKENDMYIADFVIDAVTAAESAGCDFSKYDSNDDGYVDIVYFIYAGKGQASGGGTETIWPHNWELISAIYYEQTHGGSGYYVNVNSQGNITSMNIPTFDGKKINNYACSAELRGDGNRSGIGTFCHEFSHVLGLPDYYDADGEDNGENVQTPQEWSIMDYGSYNNNEMTPPNYSIYDKYFMGWATPKFLAKDEKKDVSLTTGYDDAYQITGGSSLVEFTNTGTVYYLENRQKTGWDAALPGHGMLVWQVKYSSSVWENNAPNNTAGNARYTIVPADGKTSNYGYGSDPFPGTSNVKSYTPKTGCALTQISESDGVISFKYNGGQTKTECDYTLYGEHCTYPEDGVIAINSTLSLTITPESGYTLADASCWDVEMGGVKLTYGIGFTYNESTNEFHIEKVTDDVEIMVEGKATFQITWMANGSEFTTTTSAGSVVLPEGQPDACTEKVFVGWCANATYESETEAPTFVKNGDAVSTATTFYAVFATPGTGGGAGNWTLVTDASSLKAGDKLVLANKANNATAGAISSQILGSVASTFSGDEISSVGEGTLEFTLGGTSGSWTLSTSDGLLGATAVKKLAWDSGTTTWSISISDGDATIQNGTSSYGRMLYNSTNPRFTTYTSALSSSMLLPQLYRKSSGSSYTDYTTTCNPPCEGPLTSITINTNNVKKVFTEGEAFTYEGLVVTASYEGCDSKTVTPTSVSTPDMNQIGAQDVTVTYEDKSATYQITVNALPTYAIRFYNNTTLLSSQNVKQGQAATPPTSDPTACEEYTFVGWYTTTLAEDNTVAPSYVTNFTATKDQDYYAVFSRTEEGEGGSSETVEDQLTRATTGVSGTNYDSWSGKTANSDAFYAGNSAGGNDAIQLRSNNNNSGIVTTTSGGTIKKVVVTWNSNTTSGRTLNIYGKNTAYSAASDLYGSNAGTSLGSIVYGTSTELTISGDYTYIGVRSASGALYMDAITFTWEVGSGASSTTYYTTEPTCGEIPTYTIRFFNNGVQEGEEQIIEKGGTPEIPEDPDKLCVYYTFIGWTTSALTTETETKPTLVTDFTVTKDQDYYAVFRHIKTGELSNDYSKITTLDELTTGNYVVAGNGTKAMKNSVFSDYYLGTVSVSPSSDIISDPAETIIWNITRNNNTVSFYNEAVNQYAYLYKSGNFYDLGLQSNSYAFNVSVSNGNWSFEASDNAGQYMVYFIYTKNNNSTHEFAAKTSSSNSIYLYKQQNSSITSYVTTVDCGALTDIEETSVEPAAVKALMNGQIVIIRGEAVYSITGVRIQ